MYMSAANCVKGGGREHAVVAEQKGVWWLNACREHLLDMISSSALGWSYQQQRLQVHAGAAASGPGRHKALWPVSGACQEAVCQSPLKNAHKRALLGAFGCLTCVLCCAQAQAEGDPGQRGGRAGGAGQAPPGAGDAGEA